MLFIWWAFLIVFVHFLDALPPGLPKGATLITNMHGLRIPEIHNRYQLNKTETIHTKYAHEKYMHTQRHHPLAWFNEAYLRQIHKDMFGDVWEWGGIYYSGSQRNIGVVVSDIPKQMAALCQEVRKFLTAPTHLTFLEQSARILWRLQYIHPFTNGNGRHARLVSSLYLQCLHGTAPDWPEAEIAADGPQRNAYVEALKAADEGDFWLLENLISRYGGGNPTLMAVVEDSFFTKFHREELLNNIFQFSCRVGEGTYISESSPQMSLLIAASRLIKQ